MTVVGAMGVWRGGRVARIFCLRLCPGSDAAFAVAFLPCDDDLSQKGWRHVINQECHCTPYAVLSNWGVHVMTRIQCTVFTFMKPWPEPPREQYWPPLEVQTFGFTSPMANKYDRAYAPAASRSGKSERSSGRPSSVSDHDICTVIFLTWRSTGTRWFSRVTPSDQGLSPVVNGTWL